MANQIRIDVKKSLLHRHLWIGRLLEGEGDQEKVIGRVSFPSELEAGKKAEDLRTQIMNERGGEKIGEPVGEKVGS